MQLLSSGGHLWQCLRHLADQSLLPQMSFRFNSAGIERMGTICFHFKITQMLLLDVQSIKINLQGLISKL